MANDKYDTVINKVAGGQTLDGNDQATFNTVCSEQSERGQRARDIRDGKSNGKNWGILGSS